MSTKSNFLAGAYNITSVDDQQKMYDEWADTYDHELIENGYVTPQRIAKALSDLEADKNTAILDIGCGTGLSGHALTSEGFTKIDGTDFNEKMLEYAKVTPYYRNVFHGDASKPMTLPASDYQHVIAAGVIATGLIPPSGIKVILDIIPSNGLFLFSLNDHTLSETIYEKEVNSLIENGTVTVAFKEYGPHIPGKEINSLIYGLRKV